MCVKCGEGDGVTVRVLLVEDMKQMQAVVMDLLSAVGDFHVVGLVATEAEAKLWLADNPGAWDLAIVDLVLDQGSGLAVVPRAREARHGDAHIIVFSDYASGGIRSHCEKLGADAVFLKSESREFMNYCSALGGPAAASIAA
jgi:DNA-binding NarL/FixJ family response regulator